MRGDEAGADRKAEYARQLREQMASDKAMKRAADGEKGVVTMSTPRSSGMDGNGTGDGGRVTEGDSGGDPVKKLSKAEYARELREQMAAKESARRIEGQRARSPSANTGPSWIKGATEGREQRRRNLKGEYAEQLRAQIARRSKDQRDASAQSRDTLGAVDDPRQSVHERGQDGWSQRHRGGVAREVHQEQEWQRDFSQDSQQMDVLECGERREAGGGTTMTPHRASPQDSVPLER